MLIPFKFHLSLSQNNLLQRSCFLKSTQTPCLTYSRIYKQILKLSILSLIIIFQLSNSAFSLENIKKPKLSINIEQKQSRTSEEVFGRLNKNKISTGILYDKVVPFSQIEKYNGESFNNALNFDLWKQIYSEIYRSHLAKPDMPELAEIRKKTEEKIGYKKEEDIALGVINFNFNRIKEAAFKKQLLAAKNSQIFDGPNIIESPYDLKKVFAFAALTNKWKLKPKVNFVLKKEFYFCNSENKIQKIEIDFDDTNGFRRINFDQKISINYFSPGEKNIKIKIFSENQILIGAGKIYIKEIKPESVKNNLTSGTVLLSQPLEILEIEPDARYSAWQNLTSNYAFQGVYANYDAYVKLAAGHTKIIKPILFIEGFDPKNEYGFSEIFEKANKENLINNLLNSGYDLIILNYHDGADYIQRNALAVVSLLEKINQ